MPNYLYALASGGLVAALAVGLTAASAATDPGVAEATATQYNVTTTLGPFNGVLPVGATVPCSPARSGCVQSAPGSIPEDQEARSVTCHNSHDALLTGSAVIDLKTSHGTAKAATVDLDRIGAFYDPDAQIGIGWGTFVRPNGKVGWSSVTISITCLVRK